MRNEEAAPLASLSLYTRYLYLSLFTLRKTTLLRYCPPRQLLPLQTTGPCVLKTKYAIYYIQIYLSTLFNLLLKRCCWLRAPQKIKMKLNLDNYYYFMVGLRK